ncbi:MAG: hypothetical protein B7Y99_09340 [Caulobacterales bacterium 32-69-10]|nr:MAG: hypothetical protein B7Y99_09340 [Caulobacterales bacterium 32-69-10]
MPRKTSAPAPISEPDAPRKPPRRWMLYAPFVVLVVALVAYGGFWFVAKSRLEGAIDARAEAMRAAGYTVTMDGRRVDGLPFRMRVAFDEARIITPTGWSIAVPGLKGEAYLHALGHWVFVAPQGLTVVRPQGGGLAVKGQALRASINGTATVPWRIVLEGTKLAFTPAAGARPFSLASAERLEWYLRPAPNSADGMSLIRLEGGKAAPQTLLHRIVSDAAVTANLQGRLTNPGAFQGADWAEAVRAWSRAGGTIQGVEGSAAGGAVSLKTKGGALSVGSDGRLAGAIPLEMKQAGAAITALGEGEALDPGAASSAAAVAAARAQGEAANLNLVFQAGAATLGPVRIGPAPKVG